MRPRMYRRLLAIGLLAIVLACAGWWLSRPRSLPAVTLNFSDGTRVQSTALSGSPLVVNFWSVNCGPCLRERPKLAQLHADLKAHDGQLITVSMPYDPPSAILTMLKKQSPPYPNVLDVHGEVNRAFGGIHATPTTLFFNRQGKLAKRITGEVDLRSARKLLTRL